MTEAERSTVLNLVTDIKNLIEQKGKKVHWRLQAYRKGSAITKSMILGRFIKDNFGSGHRALLLSEMEQLANLIINTPIKTIDDALGLGQEVHFLKKLDLPEEKFMQLVASTWKSYKRITQAKSVIQRRKVLDEIYQPILKAK